jgi:hypothetical protein
MSPRKKRMLAQTPTAQPFKYLSSVANDAIDKLQGTRRDEPRNTGGKAIETSLIPALKNHVSKRNGQIIRVRPNVRSKARNVEDEAVRN